MCSPSVQALSRQWINDKGMVGGGMVDGVARPLAPPPPTTPTTTAATPSPQPSFSPAEESREALLTRTVPFRGGVTPHEERDRRAVPSSASTGPRERRCESVSGCKLHHVDSTGEGGVHKVAIWRTAVSLCVGDLLRGGGGFPSREYLFRCGAGSTFGVLCETDLGLVGHCPRGGGEGGGNAAARGGGGSEAAERER